jgi:hypothetical protein
MNASIVSEMLRLFRDGADRYQPGENGLLFESGSPEASLSNLRQLVASGLVIQDILIRPTGALVIFSTGEQYFALGLRVADGDPTEALARIASEADFGPFDRLLPFYQALPADYDGKLPDVDPD